MLEKLREVLEYLFYMGVVGLMYIGPPPSQDVEAGNSTSTVVASASHVGKTRQE